MIKNKWIALFSRTGTEITNIINDTGRIPDRIICNKPYDKRNSIHSDLLSIYRHRLLFLPNNPTLHDYLSALGTSTNTLVTCHGWMRIIPTQVCQKYEIYNGHPGLANFYPELKGKDPQLKVLDKQYKTIGSIIHKVTPEVDGGKVIKYKETEFENFTKDTIFDVLANLSKELWIEFLNEYNG